MAKLKVVKDRNGKVISTTKIDSKGTAKIELERHEIDEKVPEHYTYIDSAGVEKKYAGVVSKSSDSAIGKTFETHVVHLEYHPAIEHVAGNDEYFTYIGKNGKPCVYTGKVEFDLESNCYIGKTKEAVVENTIIEIFEEK